MRTNVFATAAVLCAARFASASSSGITVTSGKPAPSDVGAGFSTLSAGSPVKLSVVGPKKLQLEVRPRVSADSPSRLQLEILVDGKSSPMSLDVGSELAKLGKGAKSKLGAPHTKVLDLAAGKHAVEVKLASGGEAYIAATEPSVENSDFMPLAGLDAPLPPLGNSAGAADEPPLTGLDAPLLPLAAPSQGRVIEARRVEGSTGAATSSPPTRGGPTEVPAPVTGLPAMSFTPILEIGTTSDFGFGAGANSSLSESTTQVVYGGVASWQVMPALGVDLGFRDHVYRRNYLLSSPSSRGRELGLSSFATDEQKLDLDLTARYELLHLFSKHASKLPVALQAFIGPGFRFFANDIAGMNLGGAIVGGLLSYSMSDAITLNGGVGWLYNFMFKNTDATGAPLPLYFGKPRAETDFSASATLHLQGNARLTLGYEGEVLALERDYRAWHAVSLAVDLGF